MDGLVCTRETMRERGRRGGEREGGRNGRTDGRAYGDPHHINAHYGNPALNLSLSQRGCLHNARSHNDNPAHIREYLLTVGLYFMSENFSSK